MPSALDSQFSVSVIVPPLQCPISRCAGRDQWASQSPILTAAMTNKADHYPMGAAPHSGGDQLLS